eukprot:1156647-Pelagomonas_calceolata.AAC.7
MSNGQERLKTCTRHIRFRAGLHGSTLKSSKGISAFVVKRPVNRWSRICATWGRKVKVHSHVPNGAPFFGGPDTIDFVVDQDVHWHATGKNAKKDCGAESKGLQPEGLQHESPIRESKMAMLLHTYNAILNS